jgi:hypothetical protein
LSRQQPVGECACVSVYIICLLISHPVRYGPPYFLFFSKFPPFPWHRHSWHSIPLPPTPITYVSTPYLQCFLNFSSHHLVSTQPNPSTQHVTSALRDPANLLVTPRFPRTYHRSYLPYTLTQIHVTSILFRMHDHWGRNWLEGPLTRLEHVVVYCILLYITQWYYLTYCLLCFDFT